MLQNLPFIGEFPTAQRFGENPHVYRKVICGGIRLRGHNGIDYALPPGTLVIGVQNGVVLEAGEDPEGFGRFVLLGHRWGQSLYAHLSEIHVHKGQQVGAGQLLGMSGNSGLSVAPHLHFGMRISPFSVSDGWCGYSDPAPYLDRLTQPLGALMGPHIIEGTHAHLDTLARWQPRLLVVLDPNPDEIRTLRQVCPDTVIIGRVFEPDHVVQDRIRSSPKAAARWAHEKTLAHMSPEVDYWQFANEVLQETDGLPLLDSFEHARMALADKAGYKCAILGFSVGSPNLPEDDRMALWQLVYPAIAHAEEHNHIVTVHQYGMPDLWGPDDLYDWYIHRLEHQVLRRLPYKGVKFAVTEYGIDGMILGSEPAGWQEFTDATGYAQQLLKASSYLERFSGRVLGYAIFTLGHFSPWQTYDIEGDVARLLADQSQRGTWDEVDTDAPGIIPGDTDVTTDPGGEAIDDGSPDPGDGNADEPDDAKKPLVEHRLDQRFHTFHMAVKTLADRPDEPGGDLVYLVKDIFMTEHGSWEDTGEESDIPGWAREAYLKPEFAEAGANHHLFAAVIGVDGRLSRGLEVIFWSDGFERLEDPAYSDYVRERTKDDSGWATLFMSASSSFAPDRGETGPWCWAPTGASEVVCGGGLPLGHPVSTFVVWQAVTRQEWEESQDEKPDDGGEGIPPSKIDRRASRWIPEFNVAVKTTAERPDHPDEDVVYILKDLFTTRNGSWEPSDEPGSVTKWARDDYLKSFGSPNYFDDAGGDHHLFAAVIGLDGKLMPQKVIRFWPDGFPELGNPAYDGYVLRDTKVRSGWANVVIGPGSSFVPERGESGPWCWTPTGMSEVVCGGGLPSNQHISTFAVWQAVKRKDPAGKEHDFSTVPPFTTDRLPAIPLMPLATKQSVLDAVVVNQLRQAVWSRVGIEFEPDSIIGAYARHHEMGMPVTQEFEDGGFRVQGFHGGIVFVRIGDLDSVAHVSW